jgi:hypothetical protein
MDRLVCALFEDKPHASAAMDALVNGGVGDDVVTVSMHEGSVTHEDLGVAAGLSGRRMVQGAVIGAAVGGLVGAVVGFVIAPAGALLTALLVSVFAGGALGVLYSTLAGAITGRDSEQPVLENLSKALEAGKVLVTLEVHGSAAVREAASDILRQFGGRHITVN